MRETYREHRIQRDRNGNYHVTDSRGSLWMEHATSLPNAKRWIDQSLSADAQAEREAIKERLKIAFKRAMAHGIEIL